MTELRNAKLEDITNSKDVTSAICRAFTCGSFVTCVEKVVITEENNRVIDIVNEFKMRNRAEAERLLAVLKRAGNLVEPHSPE